MKSEQHKLPLTVTLFDGIHLVQVTVLQQIKKICVTELFFFSVFEGNSKTGAYIQRGDLVKEKEDVKVN